jgi:plasmid stability protein
MYDQLVTKTIQIRDVPDDVHATLRARAVAAGESLSDYLRAEMEQIAHRPAIADVLRRARSRTEGPTTGDALAALHGGRAERDDELGAE